MILWTMNQNLNRQMIFTMFLPTVISWTVITHMQRRSGKYHDLYMKIDVLLLADVLGHFRDTALEYYKLDPAHYYTLPGLGWDVMLKMGDVELELLSDTDMHLIIEQGLRGGISMISTKYVKANNPYLNHFKPSEPTTYIIYWDANNLYGHALSQPLPERNFQWMTSQDIDSLEIMNIPMILKWDTFWKLT